MISNLTLSSPWVEYARKVHALFERDPEITIEYNEQENVLTLHVDNTTKSDALKELLPANVTFGNVILTIKIVATEKVKSKMDLLKEAFAGNPIVTNFIEASPDPAGLIFDADYVLFEKTVVQYFNDDLSDANRVRSTLYADIAKEVINVPSGINFCTDVKNPEALGSPLGEWP